MTQNAGWAPRPKQVQIGLWGPPGSGKTTYLAALWIAVNRFRQAQGVWNMSGADPEVSDWLASSVEELTSQGRFPQATRHSTLRSFLFRGEVPAPPVRGFRMPQRRGTPALMNVGFDLNVFDPPGKLFEPRGDSTPAEEGGMNFAGELDPAESPLLVGTTTTPEEDMMDHLHNCDGIVFLFDPIRDAEHADAFTYFYRTLEQLAAQHFSGPNGAQPRLPHYFAVCVTKFDDPLVYRKARRYGLTTPDEHEPYAPRVTDEYAEGFFRQLCKESPGNADLVMNSIDKYLDHSRVRYFVTSAIGLYSANGRFRSNDPVNLIQHNDGTVKVRGKVQPMNLVEPLLWLEECLRSRGPATPGRS